MCIYDAEMAWNLKTPAIIKEMADSKFYLPSNLSSFCERPLFTDT